jgi:hypothetical protein
MGKVSIKGFHTPSHHMSFKSSLHVIKAPKGKAAKIKI